EEGDYGIDTSSIAKDVVDLNTIQAGRLQAFEFFRVSGNRDLSREHEQTIAVCSARFVAVYKENSTMHATQSHSGGIKVFFGMLGHDYKLQLVGLGRSNDL